MEDKPPASLLKAQRYVITHHKTWTVPFSATWGLLSIPLSTKIKAPAPPPSLPTLQQLLTHTQRMGSWYLVPARVKQRYQGALELRRRNNRRGMLFPAELGAGIIFSKPGFCGKLGSSDQAGSSSHFLSPADSTPALLFSRVAALWTIRMVQSLGQWFSSFLATGPTF